MTSEPLAFYSAFEDKIDHVARRELRVLAPTT